MDFDKLDWNKYQIRFNQQIYNQLSIMKDNKIKYVITFHFIGMINTHSNNFFWANIIPGVNLKFSRYNNKIKNLKYKYENLIDDNELYYQILSEDIIHIDDKITPDFLKIFFNKLLKQPILILNSSNIHFQIISVKDIIESY